jgi:hypothetical protein
VHDGPRFFVCKCVGGCASEVLGSSCLMFHKYDIYLSNFKGCRMVILSQLCQSLEFSFHISSMFRSEILMVFIHCRSYGSILYLLSISLLILAFHLDFRY